MSKPSPSPFGAPWMGTPTRTRSNAAMAQALRDGTPRAEVAASAGLSVQGMFDLLADAGWGTTGQPIVARVPVLKRVEPGPDLSWMLRGACGLAGADAFFPDTNTKSAKDAQAVCAVCMVRRRCLGYALTRDDMGVWGGFSRNARRDIKRRLAAKREAS